MNHYQILFRNIPQQLTYQSEEAIPVGSLVRVIMGKRTLNGIVIEKTPAPAYECVNIEKILIPEAISPLQIELCRWMSRYYFASLNKCVQLFIPGIIWNQTVQPKREWLFSLNLSFEIAKEQLKRAKKQLQLLQKFENAPVQSERELKKEFSTATINTLLKKGILAKKEGELLNPDEHHKSKPYHDQPLTEEQQEVLRVIASAASQSRTFLLHGITGSGKTEIYLHLIKKNIQEGKQTILLVPEIALTTELIQYFTAHFPDQISILHSRLSDGDRVQTWHRIHQEKTKLILGSRSALFTPWKNLGAIILDEEHEWNYKQESSPRYHAKTVAEQIVEHDPVWAGHAPPLHPAPILVLGSATPSIESYFMARGRNETSPVGAGHAPPLRQRYHLASLTHRANFSSLPPVTIVDLRDEYKKKNFTMFSDTLRNAIQERLNKKEQIILFLNKRGSSSSVTCRDCGYTPRCPNCDIALTFHSQIKEFEQGGLICHYCGNFQEGLSKCPRCKSIAIRHLGSGTQKAEEQLHQLFPNARTLRADKDTTTGKYDFEEIYHQMREGKADILIGTQMIAKGLDLPNVTLTGIIIADIGLHLPDFRANERVFQLLTQVAGRSGRHQPGEVIIQTYQPDHPVLQFAKTHDYKGFYEHEIAIREQHFYPPFSSLIKLTFAHEDAKIAKAEAQKLFSSFAQAPTITLSPHYIPRLHGKFIWNILLRGENPRDLLKQIDVPKGWKIDVDPR